MATTARDLAGEGVAFVGQMKRMSDRATDLHLRARSKFDELPAMVKRYIETRRDEFISRVVIKHRLEGEAQEMLMMPVPYDRIFYRDGCFWAEVRRTQCCGKFPIVEPLKQDQLHDLMLDRVFVEVVAACYTAKEI